MNTDKGVFAVQILGDNFSRQFIHHARPLLCHFGFEGEKSVREGVRRYGRDRGRALREQHLARGFKINLKTIFGGNYDLPADPRVDKKTLVLTEQVRRALVFTCPIADIWAEMDATDIGRMYCEEFHHAMWGTYAAGAQINLTQTLTQDGDDRCNFSVYQRPANIDSPEELAASFAEHDPEGETKQILPAKKRTVQQAYEDMCLRLFQAMDSTALSILPNKEDAYRVLCASAESMAEDFVAHIVKALKTEREALTLSTIAEYSPFGTRERNEEAWKDYDYTDVKPREIMEKAFFPAFEQAVAKVATI